MPAPQQRRNTSVHLTTPYRFVPLSEQVHYPDWQDIAFDIPHPDGLSGEIAITLTADSPILVGQERQQDGHVRFYRTPDNQYAIPGSTLRGHIRTLIEMLTAARLSLMDEDVRHSFRDLTLPEYRNHLTTTHVPGRNGTFEAKAQAGWLNPDTWRITPVDHYRIDYADLNTMGIRIDQRRRDDAPRLYARHTQNRIQTITFTPHEKRPHAHSDGKQLIYAKATPPKGGATKRGYLIFTGQPNPRKHMAFVFMPSSDRQPIPVPNQVRKDFMHIYENSDHWHYLKRLATRQQDLPGIPVFYIPDSQGAIRYLGLSQMFRFPYQYKVGDLRPAAHKAPDQDKLDFAELLFGTVGDNANAARKGRVSFCLLTATHAEEDRPYSAILNSPKSSFYPTYVAQTPGARQYNNWNSDNARLAGRKLYPPHREQPDQQRINQHLDPKHNYERVTTHLHPLKAGATFTGKIRFHNVLPEELGVLLLALTLSEQGETATGRFHTLGMGKPYGFGKCRVHIDRLTCYYESDQPEPAELIQRFIDYARTHFDKKLETLRQVLCLHTPGSAKDLAYMPLNRFAEVKRQARQQNQIQTLPTGWVKGCLDNLQKQQRQAASQPKKQEQPKAPLDIFKKPASQLGKQDILSITEAQVAQLNEEWREKLKQHIELSSWWQGLNAKARKKNRQKLKHIFTAD